MPLTEKLTNYIHVGRERISILSILGKRDFHSGVLFGDFVPSSSPGSQLTFCRDFGRQEMKCGNRIPHNDNLRPRVHQGLAMGLFSFACGFTPWDLWVHFGHP